MSSDEDDFMSDKFLPTDKGPGLAQTHFQKRELQIERNRLAAEEEQRKKFRPKHVIEKERREEALSKPVSEESKGFQMLAKMGFKAGMSLGKKKDENDLGSGIKEPVSVDLKTNRTGLGHETHLEEQSKERLQATMDRMKQRARMADELIDDFRKRRRGETSQKKQIGDLVRCRKTCVELDLRAELTQPTVSWFWPSYRERKAEDDIDGVPMKRSRFGVAEEDDVEEEDERYVYTNGETAPKEVRFNELTDEELDDRIREIVPYLRETHRYCVWCGCQFETPEELGEQCPGDTRDVHEGVDE